MPGVQRRKRAPGRKKNPYKGREAGSVKVFEKPPDLQLAGGFRTGRHEAEELCKLH